MPETPKKSQALVNWLKTQNLANTNPTEQDSLAQRIARNYSPLEIEAAKQEFLGLIHQAQNRERTRKFLFNSLIVLGFLTAVIFWVLS
ncbi:hypothetical protein HC931_07560 [Candidatus Gracilibacteria bacterium]|nr:hypothetical protein [Candidatus Gracilibacteria bacterium]NJM90425.1 hypothetical protein [Hydrococcus sp. RU_2_2]NJP19779.1 hypothetical protein [Hydrococcus sp. CRU_1_1]